VLSDAFSKEAGRSVEFGEQHFLGGRRKKQRYTFLEEEGTCRIIGKIGIFEIEEERSRY